MNELNQFLKSLRILPIQKKNQFDTNFYRFKVITLCIEILAVDKELLGSKYYYYY